MRRGEKSGDLLGQSSSRNGWKRKERWQQVIDEASKKQISALFPGGVLHLSMSMYPLTQVFSPPPLPIFCLNFRHKSHSLPSLCFSQSLPCSSQPWDPASVWAKDTHSGSRTCSCSTGAIPERACGSGALSFRTSLHRDFSLCCCRQRKSAAEILARGGWQSCVQSDCTESPRSPQACDCRLALCILTLPRVFRPRESLAFEQQRQLLSRYRGGGAPRVRDKFSPTVAQQRVLAPLCGIIPHHEQGPHRVAHRWANHLGRKVRPNPPGDPCPGHPDHKGPASSTQVPVRSVPKSGPSVPKSFVHP